MAASRPTTDRPSSSYATGRDSITSATAPDGTRVVYHYDEAGRLTSVRQMRSGTVERYGYESELPHRLRVITGGTGGTGSEVIEYGAIAQSTPVLADLGTPMDFQGQTQTEVLAAGESHRYSFSVLGSELASTATGTVLVRATVAPNSRKLAGARRSTTGRAVAAEFPIRRRGPRRCSRSRGQDSSCWTSSPAHPLSTGEYQFEVGVAGDINFDGAVDGLDSQILADAQGTRRGDVGYVPAADLDGSGLIDAADTRLLMQNYGFIANLEPCIQLPLPSPVTHLDLSLAIDLSSVALDPDGDPVWYRVVAAGHGQAMLDPAGRR